MDAAPHRSAQSLSDPVAVIGGGWAGLSAAIHLTLLGLPVELFEAGRKLGGRARSTCIEGRTLDNGQHLLLGAYTSTLALMQTIGLDWRTVLNPLPLHIQDSSGFCLHLPPSLPAPLHLAWGLIMAQGPSLREKFRTALWVEGLKRRRFLLPLQGLTVSAWLDQAGQTGCLRRHFWEPLCLAALNTPPQKADAQVFAHVLRDSLGNPLRSATDLLLPTQDLDQVLPAAAHTWLQQHQVTCHLGQRVRKIDPQPGQILVDGRPYRGVVVAVAPQHLQALVPDQPVPETYEPIATLYLQFPPALQLPFPLLSVLDDTGKTGDFWVVDRGQGLMAVVFSGHGPWEERLEPNTRQAYLVRCVRERLEAWIHHEQPTWSSLIIEKRATFSCRPGIPRPDWKTAWPRLVLAGDSTWHDYPGTLEGAVRSGERAAAGLAQHLGI